jgi:hypothetical protein
MWAGIKAQHIQQATANQSPTQNFHHSRPTWSPAKLNPACSFRGRASFVLMPTVSTGLSLWYLRNWKILRAILMYCGKYDWYSKLRISPRFILGWVYSVGISDILPWTIFLTLSIGFRNTHEPSTESTWHIGSKFCMLLYSWKRFVCSGYLKI